MTKIRIAGAIASKSGITLYLENGEQMELAKSSHRTNEIMQHVAKPLARKKIVDIDLADFSAHARIEKKTGGLIRFMKDKVSNFFGLKGEGGSFLGMIPLKEDETVVAVIGGQKIPGMEKLERQIEHASFTQDCKGFKLFLERLAAVIDERGHTVQELLTFMQKGDLPIADDGSIIAYKTLSHHDEAKGIFVDVHSKAVQQKVGSRVSMPMEDVNSSRRTECSTGLHIARRRYIRSYFGDLLVLAKIAPEDVIAVPHGDPNKMRVMAYHIVARLSDVATSLIRQDKPMTSDAASAKLLADVIAGDHIGVLEEVRISREKVEKPKTTSSSPWGEKDAPKEVVIEEKEDIQPFLGAGDNGMAAALDDVSDEGEVDIRSLNKQIDEVVDEEEVAEPEKVVELPKPVDPTAKPLTAAQQKREEAYQAVIGGMSQREAAKQFKVCAKTLRKMVRERAPKAAE